MAQEDSGALGTAEAMGADERELANLGYKQELTRGWNSFTNFAISFTIISVLAGCVTNFSFAWNAGGPIAISLGWPILCCFVLLVAFSMAELTSAFPTAGGPYWWAAKLGGAGWSWITGWFNIVGLVGIVAGVGYGAAFFLQAVLGLYGLHVLGINFATTNPKTILHEDFLLFLLILIGYTVVNIFADRLLAIFNNISVGWHVLGVLGDHRSSDLRPHSPPERQLRVRTAAEQHRVPRRSDRGRFLLAVRATPRLHPDDVHADRLRRLGAHCRGDPRRRQGSRPGSVAFGVLFSDRRMVAAPRAVVRRHSRGGDQLGGGRGDSGGGNRPHPLGRQIRADHLHGWSAVLRRGRPNQRLAHVVCVLARPRNARLGAVSARNHKAGAPVRRAGRGGRCPHHHDPGYFGNKQGVPWAYFAITSICTVGLYLAYILPVYLRLRKGADFKPGPWSLGRKYRWINVGAIAFVVLVVYALDGPTHCHRRAMEHRLYLDLL